MTTPEQRLSVRVRRVLRPRPHRVHLVRIENAVGAGTPDLSWAVRQPGLGLMDLTAEGWLELKVARLPVRAGTPVRIDVRPAQRIWWLKRYAVGGRVHVLLRLAYEDRRQRALDEHLLLIPGPATTRDLMRGVPVERLRSRAVARWGPRLDDGAGPSLIEALMAPDLTRG